LADDFIVCGSAICNHAPVISAGNALLGYLRDSKGYAVIHKGKWPESFIAIL
jgi:hypothetical protein|tara:strand:+ start:317 stop:472 length:156 start_codon:yes stop_codon:yes gene_type:complete